MILGEKHATSHCWFEDERGPQTKKCGQPLETGKSEKTFLPRNL